MKALIVEDDESMIEILQRYKKIPFDLVTKTSHALTALNHDAYDAVVCDYHGISDGQPVESVFALAVNVCKRVYISSSDPQAVRRICNKYPSVRSVSKFDVMAWACGGQLKEAII